MYAQRGGVYPEPVEGPLSVFEIFGGTTLKAERVECPLKEVAPTLSRPLRGLRQGVAQFTFALKTPLALSGLESFDTATLKASRFESEG